MATENNQDSAKAGNEKITDSGNQNTPNEGSKVQFRLMLSLFALIFGFFIYWFISENKLSMDEFRLFRRTSAGITILIAAMSLSYVYNFRSSRYSLIVFGLWSVAVPVYFFLEYYAVDLDLVIPEPSKHKVLMSLTIYSNYLRNVWAGVIAIMGALVIFGPKKSGNTHSS